jgi:hypothetical protein
MDHVGSRSMVDLTMRWCCGLIGAESTELYGLLELTVRGGGGRGRVGDVIPGVTGARGGQSRAGDGEGRWWLIGFDVMVYGVGRSSTWGRNEVGEVGRCSRCLFIDRRRWRWAVQGRRFIDQLMDIDDAHYMRGNDGTMPFW